jgi:hypothetical protein
MSTQLQAIVDTLAMRLDRAVAVDDRNSRLLAYSSHPGPVDEIRMSSILSRRAPDAAWKWALAHGINKAERPIRLPAKPDIGMEPRVGMPVRCQGVLLGYLWLIDPDGSVSDDELDVVVGAAEAAGTVLYREQLLSDLELGRERELLRDLVSDDEKLRQHAAAELVESNLFVASTSIVALVVWPVHEDGRQPDEAVRLALSVSLDNVRRMLSPRQRLHLARPDHGLFLAVTTDPSLPSGGIEDLAVHLRDNAVNALKPQAGWQVYVGIGGKQQSTADAAVSYRQAQQAVRVGRIVRSFGPVISWSQLGIYRMLSQFPVEQLATEALPPGLTQLFASHGASTLVETLECYLDCGCDAKTAASTLSLHRASLYYRLHKIEDITGISLRGGEERLALHLGLKLARLAGVHPEQAAVPELKHA